MAENRLTRVLRLVDEALQREGDARTAFLDAACSGDAALRKEVESLLARRPQDGAFLESPPWVPDRPPLVAGARLGPYQVEELIGTGGMGEVYKARDTRLDRRVAIKVLPPAFSADPDRRARFEREAKTIAALDHPHICALHDVGRAVPSSPSSPVPIPQPPITVDYLVLELLDGVTLSSRLERGAMPPDQALAVGVEIADAPALFASR